MNTKKQNLLFLFLLAGVAGLEIWKAFRGIGCPDEHFYATLGYRFARGDGLFRDDWHIAQMISFFLEPAVRLFLVFKKGTDGIVLYMRFLYAAFTLFCGGALYVRFRTAGRNAVFAALIWMLYTPFQIMALSYNTMSPGFVLLAACAYPQDSDSMPRLILTGILASFAVINTPYLALIYVFLTLLTLVKPMLFSRTHWAGITIGVLLSAAAFLLWVSVHTPLSEAVSSLSHLIDPSHSADLQTIYDRAKQLFRFYPRSLRILLAEPLIALFLRRREKIIRDRFLDAVLVINLLAVLYAAFLGSYQGDLGGHGTCIFPFAVYGLCLILAKEEKEYPAVVFGISAVHSLMILVSSNVGPRSFVAPLILACAMTALMMDEKLVHPLLSGIACTALVFVLGYLKATDLYDGSGDYRVRIEKGPLAGLWDSEENAGKYASSLRDMEVINAEPCGNAMLITWNVWEYLALDKRIATFSTYPYFWEREEYIEAQEEYMRSHADRFPALAYLDQNGAPYGMEAEDPWLSEMTFLRETESGVLYEMK